MADKKIIPPETHREQIEKYREELPCYTTYAEVLRSVLEKACKAFFPDALVQSRPKSISSFAEKAARKYERYPDAVHKMTDLCGARVIMQTAEQVEAVKQFVEANFKIHEKDEKGVSLGEDKFGYRDMHYIIELRPDRCDVLGITPDKLEVIETRKAELQVRTWLQHAWADTLHDRLYKNPLTLSQEIKRTGNLLAALMEEGDRNYNSMTHELDGMLANYTSFATKKEVADEIEVQKVILSNEPNDAKKPALALRLAQLLAASGDFSQVIDVLTPYKGNSDANRDMLLDELGYALCKIHRKMPESSEYQSGLNLLQQVVDLRRHDDWSYVPQLRKREGMHARALARLAWALEPIPRERHRAREYYQQAHEHEPGNPYYLADVLGFETYSSHNHSMSSVMRTAILEAIKVCRSHAEAGIELPWAFFTAGRLSLLLGQPLEALGYYARGIHYCLAGTHCTPADAFAVEIEWIERLHANEPPPDGHRWVLELFALSEQMGRGAGGEMPIVPKAIILAGGTASLGKEMADTIRPLLEDILGSFSGKVISGGTKIGVPGCAGDVAQSLAAQCAKQFELIGYIPKCLPYDVPQDDRYDDIRVSGESGFSPDQIIQSWRDLHAAGIKPNEILCIGFGGGALSAVEYRVALVLGARVVVAYGSGGTADEIAADQLWSGIPTLMPAPIDPATFRALITPGCDDLDADRVVEMAQEFHLRYLADSAKRLPANMRPWPKLDDTFRKANIEQAKYAVRILAACGFKTRPAKEPVVFTGFTDKEVEQMAELEHGRWNVERLRDSWRPGKARNDALKIHDCLVPWTELKDGPEGVKKYDRTSVQAFPEILAKAGLEVFRP